jgi:putative transposase
MNRGNVHAEVFRKPEDDAAFRELLQQAADRVRMRVLAYCLMPNHFHLALWPRGDGDLSRFMQWLLTVLRYIERNPLRARLVAQAEDWLWSSARERGPQGTWLQPVPVAGPNDWLGWVNAPMTDAELEALRRSVNRGPPFGSEAWVQQTARRLGLEASLKPRGRRV